jgi:hypothetical protein
MGNNICLTLLIYKERRTLRSALMFGFSGLPFQLILKAATKEFLSATG